MYVLFGCCCFVVVVLSDLCLSAGDYSPVPLKFVLSALWLTAFKAARQGQYRTGAGLFSPCTQIAHYCALLFCLSSTHWWLNQGLRVQCLQWGMLNMLCIYSCTNFRVVILFGHKISHLCACSCNVVMYKANLSKQFLCCRGKWSWFTQGNSAHASRLQVVLLQGGLLH